MPVNQELMIREYYASKSLDEFQIGKWPIGLISFAAISSIVLFGFASFPTLEGWGLLNVWRNQGVNAYRHYLGMFPDRPLHVLPSLFAGFFPGWFGMGAIVVGALLALCRIAVMLLIARALRVNGITAALLTVIGVSQPWWPGSAYERYHAAQVAYSLMLLGLLLALEKTNHIISWRNISIIVVILLGFLTYQGLFIVCVGGPMLFLAFGEHRIFRNLAGSFWPACAIYLIYFSIISFLCTGNYIQSISKDNFEFEVFVKVFKVGLKSKLNAHLATVALTGVLLAATRGKLRSRGVTFLLALAIAPFAGIIFYKNDSIIRDPEHVMYAGTAWLTCLMTASARYLDLAVVSVVPRLAQAVVLVMLACGLVHPMKAIDHINTQLNVLSALDNSGIDWTEDSNVLVIDQSGKLGRAYTFPEPYLLFAMKAYHKIGNVTLCSAVSRDLSNYRQNIQHGYTDIVIIGNKKNTDWFGDNWRAERISPLIPEKANQFISTNYPVLLQP